MINVQWLEPPMSRTNFHRPKDVRAIQVRLYPINEPAHNKINKMTCAPTDDSDQPGHQPSLIRVFTVRMKKACLLSYSLSAQQRL